MFKRKVAARRRIAVRKWSLKIALAWSVGLAAALLVTDYLVIKEMPSLQYLYDDFIFFAIIAALLPIGIVDYLNRRWLGSVEDQLPEVLRVVSQAQRTGMTLPRAFEEASKRAHGALTLELKRVVAQMSWGVSFEDALRNFARRVGTPLVRRTVSLIIECYRIGGNIEQVIDQTSHYVRELQGLRKERYAQTRPYIIVIYLGVIIFLTTLYMLFKSFFLPLGELGVTGAWALGGFSVEEFKIALFYMSIIQATLGGLVAGKIGEGSIFAGLKHSAILLTLSYIIFTLL